MAQPISKQQALEFGWNAFQANFTFWLLLLLGYLILATAPIWVIRHILAGSGLFPAALFRLANLIWQMALVMGLIRIALEFCDHQVPLYSDLFKDLAQLPSFIIGKILYTLIVCAGFLLFIIPGLIWSMQFYFYNYLIVDEGLSSIDALKRSSRIMQGHKWDLGVFATLLAFINMIGFLLLVLGLFVTIPVTIVAMAWYYRQILAQSKEGETI